ncbi:MAG: OsmC family protein [Pseudomonadales bacterium]|nr:OsmC family protein [Pseudomonadales bacterium]
MDEKTFSINLRLLENYLFEIDFGEFGNIMTDEPSPLGGGEGPNPSALLAAAVANCMAASLLFALRKHKQDPGELRATVTGTSARVDGHLRIVSLDVVLRLGVAAEFLPSLSAVLEKFEEYCVVTQSVRQGIPVTVSVLDSDGSAVKQQH